MGREVWRGVGGIKLQLRSYNDIKCDNFAYLPRGGQNTFVRYDCIQTFCNGTEDGFSVKRRVGRWGDLRFLITFTIDPLRKTTSVEVFGIIRMRLRNSLTKTTRTAITPGCRSGIIYVVGAPFLVCIEQCRRPKRPACKLKNSWGNATKTAFKTRTGCPCTDAYQRSYFLRTLRNTGNLETIEN